MPKNLDKNSTQKSKKSYNQFPELEKLRYDYHSIINNINTEEERNVYLRNNPNPYHNFLLEIIGRNPSKTKDQEAHHIFSRSIKDPDDIWNVIPISFEDHNRAHKFRLETFGEKIDHFFLRLRKNQTFESYSIATKAGRATQRAKKIGIFSSKVQSELGKKGGAKQTQAKRDKYHEKLSPLVEEALFQYTVWTHSEYKTQKSREEDPNRRECIIAPKMMYLVRDLYEYLHNQVPFNSTVVYNHTGGLAKLIKGHRKRYSGWSVLILSDLGEI